MARRRKAKKQSGKKTKMSETSVSASKARARWLAVVAITAGVLVTGFFVVESLRDAGQRPAPAAELTSEQKIAGVRDEALQLARQLMTEFPNSEEPLVLMGDVLTTRGEIAEAIRSWEKALARNPKRADIYEKMATLAFDTDEFEKAISLCRKVLEIDPKMPDMHNLIARSLSPLGRYEEAIVEAEAELEISPNSWLSYFLLGRAHWKLREYDKAKQEYKKVIELQPDRANAYYGLFNVCTRLKQHEEAQQYLEKFKKLDEQRRVMAKRRDEVMTDLNFFSLSLARLCAGAHKLYRDTGNVQRAEELLKRAVALQPQNISYLERLMSFYAGTNRVPEALSLCERIREIDPNNTACHLNIGRFSMQLGHFGEAETAFRKAIACLPRHYAGYQGLARLYLRTGAKLPQAKVLAERAVELHPGADNYFILAWACDVNGNPEDALVALKRAMELDPANIDYRHAYENIRKREMSK